MQKHTKAWLKDRGHDGHSYIPCEVPNCSSPVVDVHHIAGRIGALRVDPANLVGLCRRCHTRAHSDRKFNESLKQVVENIRE